MEASSLTMLRLSACLPPWLNAQSLPAFHVEYNNSPQPPLTEHLFYVVDMNPADNTILDKNIIPNMAFFLFLIYRVNRKFFENILNDYSLLTIQYYQILRPFRNFWPLTLSENVDILIIFKKK